ncbi:MAG: DUF6804 family protein [Bacteroidia bacterium]
MTKIKIILASLLFLCLADMPYGYFQLVRFIELIGFVILAYKVNKEGKQTEAIICLVLALLFQPFFKIALGRELWNVIDAVVGILLLLSIWREKKPGKGVKGMNSQNQSIVENYYAKQDNVNKKE